MTYNAKAFLKKNADQAHPDTVALFCSSRQEVCSSIMKRTSGSTSSSKSSRRSKATRTFQSVGTKFAEQLNSLIKTLDQTNPFFIRCIKPNTVKKPKQFDDEYVRPQ